MHRIASYFFLQSGVVQKKGEKTMMCKITPEMLSRALISFRQVLHRYSSKAVKNRIKAPVDLGNIIALTCSKRKNAICKGIPGKLLQLFVKTGKDLYRMYN